MKRSVAILALLLLGACSSNPPDVTRDWSAEKLYNAAREELDGEDYTKAIGLYEKLEARYPYGRYAQMAQIEIAYAHWKDSSPALALAACDRFIKAYPDHANIDYVYYLKGRINFNEDLGLFGYFAKKDLTERDPQAAQEAFDAFRELVRRFPDSPYAEDARARMNYLVNALATAEVSVAEYYLRRSAFVAAVNRANGVLINYPKAPAIERALKVLVTAYDKMGVIDLRDDARRTLRANFPEAQVAVGVQKAWWKFW
ncbi:MAG: outer membrane protein assembly factor BamD [Burkholderiales bacterium]